MDFKKAVIQALQKNTSQASGRQGQVTGERPEDAKLVTACQEGKAALARELVRAGANPNTGALIWAVLRDSDALTRFLIEAGASPDGPPEALSVTPLMQAARYGSIKPLRALIKAGARLDVTLDELGGPLGIEPRFRKMIEMRNLTALMWAAREGRLEAARILAEAGANLSLRDGEGRDAADVAAEKGHADVAGFLRSERQRRELDAQAAAGQPSPGKGPRL